MSDSRLPWPALAVAAASLVAVGIGIGYTLRPAAPAPRASAAPVVTTDQAAPSRATHEHGAPAADEYSAATVTLTTDMVSRAGIRTVRATPGTATAALRVPGVVQPNAYRQGIVTSLVAGRVTQVDAELGDRVQPQQPLATIYSPELADAQTKFIAARAEQAAHQQRQARTQRLTAIGAATREELEEHEADRAKIDAEVEIARARLVLLGIPEERTQRLAGPQDVVTTTPVRAPFAGVVTERAANVGLNVDPSMRLFTIVDLSTVWVIADLYERDFGRVRVGSPATVMSGSYPGLAIRGRIGYIDPQVQLETRTAKLRVEVPNGSGQLRLGMYVDVQIGEMARHQGLFVPRTAVQPVGSASVVYVAVPGQAGQFSERQVEIGAASGDQVLVLSGLQPGDEVVSEGVFFLRAEREKRGNP